LLLVSEFEFAVALGKELDATAASRSATALNLPVGTAMLSISYRAARRPLVAGPAVLFGGVTSDAAAGFSSTVTFIPSRRAVLARRSWGAWP
jgi:hypothetical protein